MTPWKLSLDGRSALRTLDDGISQESRMTESIPANELAMALAADSLSTAELIAGINAEAQSRIYAKWPIWAQQNCNDGTYPPADKTQMLTDKSIVLTEAKRLTDLIIAGQPAIPAWPVI
ncbi:hypothetical protein UFOVP1155_13 [uncultured Caudovirales phage]|uniref:Uncharacterized protein n=1 Tax=uncultured Caudovirales phage TaxID=2100421 RepID=A0A6J5QRG5_9CAUD|nr:hypothetical protein UFOVP1155_13 [uncultured Caudovirales phage]